MNPNGASPDAHASSPKEDWIAIFSDVHGNLQALEACLADMKTQGATRHLCLGDIVGYGANPADCLRLIVNLRCPILLGNHDEAAATDNLLDGYTDLANAGIDFARRRLTPLWRTSLSRLPLQYDEATFNAFHASPVIPAAWPYVMDSQEALRALRGQTRPVCFIGHTHRPIIWSLERKTGIQHAPPSNTTLEPGRRYLVNVGSVGQPRDDDWRAGYVLYNPATRAIRFRRISYDLTRAQREIVRAGLPEKLAQRLASGR